jgi:DNA repair protein RecN (Recombination protein N)
MLTTLRIKNLALVTDLTLDLQPGYNVVTGETGAGKSILIGALNLILGERADRTLIRSGSDACAVEAVFDMRRLNSSLKIFLEENGLEPCEDNQLVVKRTFTNSGTNRQFINGSPTTLAILGTLGESLVDIHGPHDHQSLLNPAKQLAILDAFGKLESERENFAGLVNRRLALGDEKAALIIDEKAYAQQLDLLKFQVNEITSAAIQPNEQEQIEQDYKRTSNSARLLEGSQAALDLLRENESSLLTQAGALGRILQELQRVDSAAAPLFLLHEQAVALLNDLQSGLSHYSDKVDLDPNRLHQLEERLNLFQTLQRKYGPSLTAVTAFGEEAQRKLRSLEQRDGELQRINGELRKLESEIWHAGLELSSRRKKVIPQLGRAAGQQLADLGFKQSRLDIALATLERGEFQQDIARRSRQGLDTIEFQFAPNPGEPPRPLRAIASSGEMARVMLALKTVLSAEDRIPVLVFDEVDANVGGETAYKVGEKMLQIARNRQVLCITHLPQVAAPASSHFVATKLVKSGRTISEIRLLEDAERVTELARMLGGQTEAARKHAEAMLK